MSGGMNQRECAGVRCLGKSIVNTHMDGVVIGMSREDHRQPIGQGGRLGAFGKAAGGALALGQNGERQGCEERQTRQLSSLRQWRSRCGAILREVTSAGETSEPACTKVV